MNQSPWNCEGTLNALISRAFSSFSRKFSDPQALRPPIAKPCARAPKHLTASAALPGATDAGPKHCMNPNPVLTVPQVAKTLKVGPSTLSRDLRARRAKQAALDATAEQMDEAA